MQCDILEMVGVMRGKEIHRGRKKTTLKRMKSLLVPLIVLCCILTACSGKAPDGTASSETAMENFLNKIADGNYVMDAPKHKANELTESWLYFFNYDALLYVDVDYENEDEVLAYLEDYANTLLQKNYSPVDEDDEEGPDYYASENGFASFRYHFDQDGKLTLLFKVEKYINAAEAAKMVQAAGFPAIEFTDRRGCWR